jgi:hypothetical protein
MPGEHERLAGAAQRGVTPRPTRSRRARRPPPIRIIHVDGLSNGVVLHLNRMALVEELEPLLFPPARFPNGRPNGVILVEWHGRNDKWHLAGITWHVAARMPSNVIQAIVRGPGSPTPEQARRWQEDDERWETTYDPVLGMTPREAIRHPGAYERNGYFIWIGHDRQSGLCIQRFPVTNTKGLNADLRYYMEQGLSLREALITSKAETWKNLQMAALALMSLRSPGFVRSPRLPGLRTPTRIRSGIGRAAGVTVRENLAAIGSTGLSLGLLVAGVVGDDDEEDELAADVAAVEASIRRYFPDAK